MAGTTLKIKGAQFILTVDAQRRIIKDGSILIEGRRIEQVGKAAELEELPADSVIDAREMVVTPGFINAHYHISGPPQSTRGSSPDDPPAYLPDVFKLLNAMTEQDQYCTSLLGMTEMLKSGTTCFLDPGDTVHLGALLKACEESGCRMIVGTNVADRPNPFVPVNSVNDAVSIMEETLRDYDGRLDGRVRAWVTMLRSTDGTEELLRAAKRVADEHGTGITFHESIAEANVEDSLRERGKRPLEYLEDIGVLGPNVLLAHVIAVNETEIEALARTQTKVVTSPTTALRLGMGLTVLGKFPEMLDKGVCVALGTDAADFGQLGLIRSMYLMAGLYKDARRSRKMVPPETALEMATIQGAKALGLEKEIGSIEVGKRADIVLFDTKRAEWRTLLNPVNNLVYNVDGSSVHTVIVDGRVAVEDHRPTFVDEGELIHQAQESGEELLARTGISVPLRWPVV